MPASASVNSPTLAPLNDAQRAAVCHGIADDSAESTAVAATVSGIGAGPAPAPCPPLLVLAGAGTGKTNTLAHRVAWLLQHGVAAQRILLLTFSRRAASEMLRRAEGVLARAASSTSKGSARSGLCTSASARQLWAGTFHAIGSRLLREYAPLLQLSSGFSILDRGDAADLIDLQRQELGLASQRQRFPRKDSCLAIYSHRVNSGGTLRNTLEREYPWCLSWEAELRRLFRAYVTAKQRQQLLDYDDLLLYWQLLMQDPRLAREIGDRFDHVLVDEYQDTNRLQAEILFAMKPDGAGLCVVGDDAQSIYSFRAATVDNILGFQERFSPPARSVTLSQNYRSVQPILDAANALMSAADAAIPKRLHSQYPSSQKPRYVMLEDGRLQAQYVAERVLEHREAGVELRRQAVLMRKAQDSDLLEVELLRRDIPFVKYGGLKFLEAAHIKDMLSILRFADNLRHELAGFRVLQLLPGVGPANARSALAALAENGASAQALAALRLPPAAQSEWESLRDLLADLVVAGSWPGQVTRVRAWYEPQLERLHGNAQVRAADLAQLEALAQQHLSRASFLTELTLDPPQATGDESGDPLRDEDYLILSTVHSAKGQEWEQVYLINVVDGSFPSEFASDDPAKIDEERRLLYVAMTRARRGLELIAPLKFYVTQQRRYGERHVYGARSRFLTEALRACFEERSWPDPQARLSSVLQGVAESPPVIDVGAHLRGMWEDNS